VSSDISPVSHVSPTRSLACVVSKVSYEALRKYCLVHHVGAKWLHRTKVRLVQLVQEHICNDDCAAFMSVFAIAVAPGTPPFTKNVSDQPQRPSDARTATSCHVPATATTRSIPHTLSIDVQSCDQFPPEPCAPLRGAQIIKDFCDTLSSDNVYEFPCAVCSRLTRHAQFAPIPLNAPFLRHLINNTYALHKPQANASLLGYPQPDVLILCEVSVNRAEEYISSCPLCLSSLRRQPVPRFAPDNGLWIGNVPPVLASPNFVEKLIIARYRHNICVVRVNKKSSTQNDRERHRFLTACG
jgi:hypothetical protein